MKSKLIIFLLFSFQTFAQDFRVSHEIHNMFVGRRIPERNNKSSPINTYPIVYWHCNYMINVEKPIATFNEKELSVGAGVGAGIMPDALLANTIIGIFKLGDKIPVLSLNHQIALNYGRYEKFMLRAGYEGVYFDVSDYSFTDNYNYGFFVGGKANTGGRTFICMDINAQRFRRDDLVNFTQTPQSYFLYGFTIRAQMYFK